MLWNYNRKSPFWAFMGNDRAHFLRVLSPEVRARLMCIMIAGRQSTENYVFRNSRLALEFEILRREVDPDYPYTRARVDKDSQAELST